MEIESYDHIVSWSYRLASQWVQEHLIDKGVTSVRKFEAYKKSGGYLPKHFPRRPDDHFRNKGVWKGWGDFMGYPINTRTRYLNFKDACRVVRQANIQNSSKFKQWKQRPKNIPSRPEYYYSEWAGWPDFLGNKYQKPSKRRYSKLQEADVRIIKHQLKLGVPGAILAKNFNVSEMQISRIKRGENWSGTE